jgi:hypothetical protein
VSRSERHPRPEPPTDDEEGAGLPARQAPRKVSQDRGVIIRDLIIFQIKLLLDGLKDIVLSPLSIIAAGLDIVSPTGQRGKRLYAVLTLGERFDRWLNHFNVSERAAAHEQGLFGASRAGANTLLGRLEELVIGHAEPDDGTDDVEPPASRDRQDRDDR